ncbi:MAG: hypothetical protein HPY45_14370 [Anaerolineae bacterium]|nr:hypothetical protein [Anaerolineae bacterium]
MTYNISVHGVALAASACTETAEMAKNAVRELVKTKWLLAGIAGFAAGMLGMCLLLAAAVLILRPSFLFPASQTPLPAEETPKAVEHHTPTAPPTPGLWTDVPLPQNNGDMNSFSQECALKTCAHFVFSTSLALEDVADFYRTRLAAAGWELAQSQQSADGRLADLIFTRPFLENSTRTLNVTCYRYQVETDKKTVVHLIQSE